MTNGTKSVLGKVWIQFVVIILIMAVTAAMIIPTVYTLTKSDETVAGQVDEDPVDDPATDDPTADEPTTDDPVADEPTIDDPTEDEPTTDDPTVDEPTTDDPTEDEPTVDEPTETEPTEPVEPDEPTTDDPEEDEPTVVETVDELAVKNMNAALIEDEATNGTPENPQAAMAVIEAAGYNVKGYVAQLATNTIYYDKVENRMLIYSAESNEVTYPSEMVTVYTGVTTSENWYTIEEIYSTNFATSVTEVTTAIAAAKAGETVTIELNADLTGAEAVTSLDNGTYDFTFNNKSVTGAAAISGIDVVIDLNGYEMDLDVATSIYVINGGSLYIKGGSVDTGDSITATKSVFGIGEGSSIILENVELTSAGSVLLPCGDAAEVKVINSTLTTTGVYAISTNAASTDNYNVAIVVENSVINVEAADCDSCAIMLNVAGTLTVQSSEIYAQRQGIIVRAGTATITDTIISCTVDSELSYFSTMVSRTTGSWASGNEVAMGAVVVGNNNNGAYLADAIVTLNSCTISYEITGANAADYENYQIALYLLAENGYETNVTFEDCITTNYVVNMRETGTLSGYDGDVYTYDTAWEIITVTPAE